MNQIKILNDLKKKITSFKEDDWSIKLIKQMMKTNILLVKLRENNYILACFHSNKNFCGVILF